MIRTRQGARRKLDLRVPAVLMAACLSVVPLFASETEELLKEGDAAFASGDLQKMEQLLTQVIDAEGVSIEDCRRALLGRGVSRLARGNYQGAPQDYNDAFASGERSANLFLMRATAQGRLMHYDEAAADFEEALRLGANGAAVHYNRGTMFLRSGDSKRARADLSTAIEEDPASDGAYIYLARLLHESGADEEAVGILTRGLKVKADAVLYLTRANLYGSIGRVEDEIADLTEAIRMDETFGPAYVNRAIVNASEGRYESSVKDYSKAISLSLDAPGLRRDRAAMLIRLDRLTEAKDELDLALRLDPGLHDAYGARGRVCFALGLFDQAASDLIEYLKHDKSDKYAALVLFLSKARGGGGSLGTLDGYPESDPQEWPDAVVAFYLGRMSAAALLEKAVKEDEATASWHSCEAHFYIAQHFLLSGDSESAARHLKEAAAIKEPDLWEYHGAIRELKRIAGVEHR